MEILLFVGGMVVVLLVLKKFVMGKTVSGAEARKLVEDGAVLVDVRSPGEFGAGHIAGARNIPVSEIDARASELPKDKTIIVYCRSGARSGKARSVLASNGFENVHNLGPMSAW